MEKKKHIRGTGYKHNLGSVWAFSGIWIIVMTLSAPVLTISMMWGGVVPESTHSDIWFFLLTRTPLMLLAAVGLAIFTTTRTAGPLVALKRAFEEVRDGNVDHRVRFRQDEKHLLEVERAFNEMMVSLSERAGRHAGAEADRQTVP